MKNILLLLIVLFMSSIPTSLLATDNFSGTVVKIIDGDTCTILLPDKTQIKVRLAEIDSPEKGGQPFGNKAKQFAIDKAVNKIVTVKAKTTDRYGRTVAEIILPSGESLNRLLVQEGYAWWYRKYSNDKSLGELEEKARKQKKGLWAEKNPIPPWKWRKSKKNDRVK